MTTPRLGHGVMLACLLTGLVGIDLTLASSEEPNPPIERVRFEPAWQLSEDDEGYLIGVPISATLDPQGNVYLLDEQQATVWVFDSSGEFLRQVGGPGDGPGEFGSLVEEVIWLPSDELGVLEHSSCRLHRFDESGNPQGLLSIPNDDDTHQSSGQGAKVSGGQILILQSQSRVHRDQQAGSLTQHMFLRKRDGNENWGPELAAQDVAFDLRRYDYDERALPHLSGWDVDETGRVYVALAIDRYEITVFDSAGEVERLVTREYAHRMRSEDELERLRRARTFRACPQCPENKVTLVPHDPDVADLRIGSDGRLWVLSSRGEKDPPPGVFQVWDVLDGDGSPTSRIEIELDADRDEDRIFWLHDDRLIVARNWQDAQRSIRDPMIQDLGEAAEEAMLEVVCYERVDR